MTIKVGDRIPLTGTIWQPKQGQAWEFNLVGIYDGEDGIDKTQFFFRYDYLDENRAEYQMVRMDNGEATSYFVLFVRDVDGVWRLKFF